MNRLRIKIIGLCLGGFARLLPSSCQAPWPDQLAVRPSTVYTLGLP